VARRCVGGNLVADIDARYRRRFRRALIDVRVAGGAEAGAVLRFAIGDGLWPNLGAQVGGERYSVIDGVALDEFGASRVQNLAARCGGTVRSRAIVAAASRREVMHGDHPRMVTAREPCHNAKGQALPPTAGTAESG